MRAKGGMGVKISAFFFGSSMSHLVSLLFFSDLDTVGRMEWDRVLIRDARTEIPLRRTKRRF